MNAVSTERPHRFQRLDRPYCPKCNELMKCYATRGPVMYYKCEKPECDTRAKTMRRDV